MIGWNLKKDPSFLHLIPKCNTLQFSNCLFKSEKDFLYLCNGFEKLLLYNNSYKNENSANFREIMKSSKIIEYIPKSIKYVHSIEKNEFFVWEKNKHGIFEENHY